MRMFWFIFKILLLLVLLVALVLGGFIAYATLTDYRPKEKESVELSGETIADLPNELEFLIWNLGYCGLSKEVDFFYDGGENVITPRQFVEKNITGMKNYLSQNAKADFVLLQEVDLYSKRSHFTDQINEVNSVLGRHNHSVGINYNVKYIPIPFTKPMGRVKSGLLSLAPYKSIENTRYQFPGNYSWPKSMFFLDRCFLLQRYKTKNGKELIVVNTHNSAYDDGTLKQRQMAYMREVLLDEYNKGNYVVVGGDWNQTPPGFDNSTFRKKGGEEPYDQISISEDYLKGWNWAFDGTVATNRKVARVYDPNTTFTTVIDFFLVSPNIEVLSTTGVDLGFEYSDHQPVNMKVRLLD